MPFINIRKARREDCPRMLELVTELAIFEKAPTEVTVNPQHFEESGFGPNPVWWAYVAEAEGGIKGFALYYVRYSTWKGQKMYLEDIIVTEDWRGKGLGSLLMEALFQEAKEKKFQGVCWQVLEWNTSAIKFYERYQARLDSEWINVSVDL